MWTEHPIQPMSHAGGMDGVLLTPHFKQWCNTLMSIHHCRWSWRSSGCEVGSVMELLIDHLVDFTIITGQKWAMLTDYKCTHLICHLYMGCLTSRLLHGASHLLQLPVEVHRGEVCILGDMVRWLLYGLAIYFWLLHLTVCNVCAVAETTKWGQNIIGFGRNDQHVAKTSNGRNDQGLKCPGPKWLDRGPIV